MLRSQEGAVLGRLPLPPPEPFLSLEKLSVFRHPSLTGPGEVPGPGSPGLHLPMDTGPLLAVRGAICGLAWPGAARLG